jgi:hypothetical protein
MNNPTAAAQALLEEAKKRAEDAVKGLKLTGSSAAFLSVISLTEDIPRLLALAEQGLKNGEILEAVNALMTHKTRHGHQNACEEEMDETLREAVAQHNQTLLALFPSPK